MVVSKRKRLLSKIVFGASLVLGGAFVVTEGLAATATAVESLVATRAIAVESAEGLVTTRQSVRTARTYEEVLEAMARRREEIFQRETEIKTKIRAQLEKKYSLQRRRSLSDVSLGGGGGGGIRTARTYQEVLDSMKKERLQRDIGPLSKRRRVQSLDIPRARSWEEGVEDDSMGATTSLGKCSSSRSSLTTLSFPKSRVPLSEFICQERMPPLTQVSLRCWKYKPEEKQFLLDAGYFEEEITKFEDMISSLHAMHGSPQSSITMDSALHTPLFGMRSLSPRSSIRSSLSSSVSSNISSTVSSLTMDSALL